MQAIFTASTDGNLHQVKRIIASFPAAVSARSAYKDRLALHLAAEAGHEGIVCELLLQGAAHDAVDKDMSCPLHLAAERGHEAVVFELLSGSGRRPSVKAKRNDGATPLHLAVKNRHLGVAGWLIDHGAKADAKDKVGITPLDLAQGDADLLKVLQQVGQRPSEQTVPIASTLRASQMAPLSKIGQNEVASGKLPSSTSSARSRSPGREDVSSSSKFSVASISIPPPGPAPPTRPKGGAMASVPVQRSRPVSASVGSSNPAASKGGISGVKKSQAVPEASSSSSPKGSAATTALAKEVAAMQEWQEQTQMHLDDSEAVASASHKMLTAAMALIEAQNRRLEEMELRLAAQEQRSGEDKMRMELLEDAAAESTSCQGNAIRTLQGSVQVVEEKQLDTQLVLQDHSKQLARLKAEMTERFEEQLKESGNKGKEDLSMTSSDPQKMWQVQLDLVLQQLHQLSSRSASREDLDEIRAKTRQMQEQQQSQANASDCACKALDQRLDQLDSTLTSTSERISGLVGQVTLLQSWKAEQAAVTVDRGSGILSGTPSFEASLGGSAPWSEAGTPNGGTPRRGLGSNPELGISSSFVQRQEFQNSMQRVEERVREAAAKEASAKRWNQMALEADEWRSHRELKEKETERAIQAIEEELERANLKIGDLEGQIQDLSQLVIISPTSLASR